MKKYFLLILFSGSFFVYGQNVTFDKANFKDNEKGYQQAIDSFDAGDKIAIKQGPAMYYVAVKYYLSAEKFNPDNDQLNYKIGVCMLSNNYAFKTNALPYLQKAYELNPNVEPDIHYQLGRAYHLNMQWDKAIEEYGEYLETLDGKTQANEIADVRKKIEECNNGMALVANPSRVYIDNLGPEINTQFPEYSALISVDESEMIFTSKRPTNVGGKMNPLDGQYTEDLYISYYKDGEWGPATNMGEPIDTKGNDATAGISTDGQTLYIYRSAGNTGAIYESHLQGDTWTKAEKMSDKINQPGSYTTSVSLGPDGKTLYFVSDRPGGFGGRDIYKTVADANGNWSDAQNLGPVINTQYGEEGVDIQADGKTLYFSSEGHNSMGGYDIFKSVYDGDHWSPPENLGYPINTPDDDVFFSISASGKHAYYTSVRKDGYGEKDIYRITFLGPEKPLVESNEDNLLSGTSSEVADVTMTGAATNRGPRITLLKGIISDSVTHKPLSGSIELVDNKKNKVIANFESNSKTGKFLVSLPAGINYGIAVKAEGYLFYSANFDIPDTSNYILVEKNIALQPINIGDRIVLNNIFFDFSKSALREESISELNRIISLLKKYKSLKIEISGYTDNKGKVQYNQKLSEARAKAVVDYLEAHGIASSRLTYKGYGMEHPIATNETDEGRQLNRRTEFKIIGK